MRVGARWQPRSQGFFSLDVEFVMEEYPTSSPALLLSTETRKEWRERKSLSVFQKRQEAMGTRLS